MADGGILALVMLISFHHVQGQLAPCPAAQFGDQCEYSCHCGTSCDRITGSCHTACDEGWFKGNNRCQKENIALGKKAWTTSGTWPGGWSAEKAVDGNNVKLDNSDSCFHAARAPSDWTVDLGRVYQLYDIRVYNRAGWLRRIAGSFIYVDNDGSQLCYTFPSDRSDITNPTDSTCNRTARYVTIMNPGTIFHDNVLNICEVEIYVCSTGTFGINCSNFCHCSRCDRLTGICSVDCRHGWRGECVDTYGINCNKTCAARKCSVTSASCDRFTGSCDSDCLPGWTGNDCTQKCDSLHYGRNCSSVCSERHCSGNSSCDHVTGACDTGCVAGWKNQDCQQVCADTYGFNCAKPCDGRKCSATSASCDRFTGSCDSGCLPGWKGNDCTKKNYSTLDEKNTTALLSVDGTGNSSKNQIVLVAGTVTAVVGVILVLVIVGVVVWRRRSRRPGKKVNSDHVYYNTATPGVSIKEPGSEVSPEGSLPVGDDEGHTYTTIDEGCSQGNPESANKSKSLPDGYEPVMGKTYGKLSISQNQKSEYTGLE